MAREKPNVAEEEVQEPQLNVVDEVTEEQFEQMDETATKTDYEEVWKRVNGKILSTRGLDKVVNDVRGTPAREFYWSERKRVFDSWRGKGRTIEKRQGYVGNKKMNFYKFSE